MSAGKLSNISLKQFRIFLKNADCEFVRYNAGHEIWTKKGLTRPIVFQTHIDPVPEFIVKNILKTLSITKEDFHKLLKQNK